MALRVVGGGEEEMLSARVLVNNQNTVRATVTLPNSPPRALQKRATGDSAYAQLKREICPVTGRARKDFTGFTETSPLLKNTKHIPGILREDVHPHLDDVYQRVMRRLQRKANYQEIGAPPLAVQFGIIDDTDEEKSREKNESDSEDPLNLGQSLISSGTTTKSGSSRHKQLGRGIPPSAALAQDGHEAEDDAFFLSQQPCPKTLRLVVEHVTATVTEKLRLAETGSLKNCLCLVFESRALLERLLKEIPSYSQFQGEGERLPTAAQLQEMYQEFRRKPVVLPTARFEKEPKNGHVVASLFDSRTHPLNPMPSHSGEQPLQQQEEQTELGVSQETTTATKTGISISFDTPSCLTSEESRKVALLGEVAIVIPPTYAQSSRKRQTSFRLRKAAGAGSRGNLRFSGNGSSFTKTAPNSFARDNPLDTKRVQGPAFSGRVADDSATNTSSNTTSTTASITAASTAPGGSNVAATGLDADTPTVAARTSLADTERKQRATRIFSVGTLTDMNSTSIVHREEYEQLQAYTRTLLVEVEERKREIRELQEQLNEELDYTTQKRKVIQYLRETLYKECNVLRSQLSAAQQKQIHYQSLLKEQQQALAHAATVMNAEVRSATSASTCEGTRLPNLSTTRFSPNEVPSMAVSIGAGMQSFRRTNPNVSVIGVGRGSTHTEENEDGNGSVVAMGAAATVGGQQISIDITAIQSLLDLVLLAVENDQLIPSVATRGAHANLGNIANVMAEDPHRREKNLKKEFAEMQRQAKQNYSIGRKQLTVLLALKEQQIKDMKNFSDVHFLKGFWNDRCSTLRDELRRVRRAVQEDLESLRQFVVVSMESIARRTHVVDASLTENNTLFNTQSALRDVILSAQSLLLPMLTTEYERGYHPWPLKLRNTADPFARMIKARYGEKQLLLLREEMNALSSIYLELHHYVMKNFVSPVIKRPLPGKTLWNLCALLAMNNCTSAEVWTRVREKYTRDMTLRKNIAALNMSILTLMYRQRIVTERSTEAMQQAGMDPRLSGLPVQRTVNIIAERLHRVIAERATLRKQRQENARDVYRIWKKSQIDVYEGYTPPSQPQRLVLAEMHTDAQRPLLAVLSTSHRGENNSLGNAFFSANKSANFWDHMLSTEKEGERSTEEGDSPISAQ
ncbi:hypothetical protein C3747_48g147 [Trypanosoma cruzi]|uniref:Uncharacterized protein n=1 Tax=Trypanosoma cruzi TaxID=5693 RepID=A0A2V2WX51_TRYCR|nr:hypothetical protein C3747_48g147 [Trypanosoma cruzi]RNC44423.1 hypothetical protein TcCL_NonESM05846 [Trypanosoma cruzi]